MTEFETDVLSRLVRIETKIDNGISSKIQEHTNEIKDLHRRTTFLEKGLWIIIGAMAVLEFLFKLFFK